MWWRHFRQFDVQRLSDLHQPDSATSSRKQSISWQLCFHIRNTEVCLASHLWPGLGGQKTHRSALNSNVGIDFSVPSVPAPYFPSHSVAFTPYLQMQLRICPEQLSLFLLFSEQSFSLGNKNPMRMRKESKHGAR